MACNCNSKYDNKVPCCCSVGEPVICTTTVCLDAQPCDVVVETNCIIYNGNNHDCAGIYNGMLLTEVVDIILAGANLIDCTTTTTTDPGCQCYLVTNTSPFDAYELTTIDCTSRNSIVTPIEANQRIYICSRLGISANNEHVDITLLPFTEYVCQNGGGNCFAPAAFCHTVEVTGSANIQYINSDGILTTTGVVSNTILYLCAWKQSISIVGGAGSILITDTNAICLTNEDCLL